MLCLLRIALLAQQVAIAATEAVSVFGVVRIGDTWSIDVGNNVGEISGGWSLVDTIFNKDQLLCSLTLAVQLVLPLKKLLLIGGIVHCQYPLAASGSWGSGRWLNLLLTAGIVCSMYPRAASSAWGSGRRLKLLLIAGIVCSRYPRAAYEGGNSCWGG